MRTAIVTGNGLTISQLQYLGCDLDSSSPFDWPVPMPGMDGVRLIDRLPSLKAYLEEQNSGGLRSNFDIIRGLIANLSASPVPIGLTDDEQSTLLDTCHFLAVAYGWLQNQIDGLAASYDGWAWQRWIHANSNAIAGILSWNYDLAIERLLERDGRPYFYPGFSLSGIDSAGMKWNRPAVLIAKPHGSTNFAQGRGVQITGATCDEGPFIPMTYPRPFHAFGFGGPMDALRRDELQTVRMVADVVLPGERNRFENHVPWVGVAIQAYAQAIATAEHLIVVGFSMAECDRHEFRRAIALATDLRRITVADPAPSDELVDELRARGPELVHWPEDPGGPEVRL